MLGNLVLVLSYADIDLNSLGIKFIVQDVGFESWKTGNLEGAKTRKLPLC